MDPKIALLFIIFLVYNLGLIAVYAKYEQMTLSLMNSLAANVFVAMAYIQIMPAAVELYFPVMTGKEDKHPGHMPLQATKVNTTIATPA